jgi:hypothetical protein
MNTSSNAGGQAGIRGYLIQTLIAILDALNQEDPRWEHVTIEPDANTHKTDILWQYSTHSMAVQVKSSQNQLTKTQVVAWATQMERDCLADQLRLVLVGPSSQSVVELERSGRVEIPKPQNLDLLGMMERAAHKLDRYLECQNIAPVPAFARELLVSALLTQLSMYSTAGEAISRRDLEVLLNQWLLAFYPKSVAAGLEMQCELLLDTLAYVHPAPSGSACLALPLTFVNHGVRIAIIEWVAVRIRCGTQVHLYEPDGTMDFSKFLQGGQRLHAENFLGPFSEFAVAPGAERTICPFFSPALGKSAYPVLPWTAGEYIFEVFVKYRDRELPVLQRTLREKWSVAKLQEYSSGVSSINSVREITLPE